MKTITRIVWKYDDGKYYAWRGECANRCVRQETTDLEEAADFSCYWIEETNTMSVRPPDRCGRDQSGRWVKLQYDYRMIEIEGDNPTGPGPAAY